MHSAYPQFWSVVIIIFTRVVRPYVHTPKYSKTNVASRKLKIIATRRTVGLAEWIIYSM